MSRARLSITAIIPALEEEERIEAALASLVEGGVADVLVVDGGSADRTVSLAEGLGAQTLHEPGGLFAQLTRGAREAQGDILLFHYADVLFPPDGGAAILRALACERVVGGAFRLEFVSSLRRYRLVAAVAGWRNRARLGPFGDQSIFVRRRTFASLGGFSPTAFFEDLDLVRRLRREGKFVLLSQSVRASVRRWERRGFARTFAEHLRLYLECFARRGRKSVEGERRTESLRSVR